MAAAEIEPLMKSIKYSQRPVSALTSTAIVRLWRQEAEKSLKSVGFIPAIKRAGWKQQHFCYKRYYRLCSGLYIPAHTGAQPPTGQHPGANNDYFGGDDKILICGQFFRIQYLYKE